jgi:hypothetical protein
MNTKSMWKCPQCGELHTSYDAALDCHPPTPRTVSVCAECGSRPQHCRCAAEQTIPVPLVRCSALPMFEGRPLIVTAQLEASQVELTVLHKRNGAFFDLTRIHFCVPANSIQPTGELATLSQAT